MEILSTSKIILLCPQTEPYRIDKTYFLPRNNDLQKNEKTLEQTVYRLRKVILLQSRKCSSGGVLMRKHNTSYFLTRTFFLVSLFPLQISRIPLPNLQWRLCVINKLLYPISPLLKWPINGDDCHLSYLSF